MNEIPWKPRKVVIVGAGDVGSTFAYALAQSGLAEEIALIDKNRDFAKGQVLDLAHGNPFFPTVKIKEGSSTDYRDAHVIIIAAGSKQRPGESRLDLLHRNASIMREIVKDIVKNESGATVVVVSNPVDILTYVALKESTWERARILGSGTVLDSARFRYLLSHHCKVDVHNVHAYILGEHGDSEFVAWSLAHVAGMSMNDYCPICGGCEDWRTEREKILEAVRKSAYHIINYKGATYFAVGLALTRIVGAILRNERSVLTVSTLLNGEYGVKDVCLSVPGIMTQRGVERIIEGSLSPQESESLRHSASVLRKVIAELY
jgi:L-lactate dehydrogenase